MKPLIPRPGISGQAESFMGPVTEAMKSLLIRSIGSEIVRDDPSSPSHIALAGLDSSQNLNNFGLFPKYDHMGRLSHKLPEASLRVTDVLAIDCEMVGVGLLKVDALARVSVVNEYGACIYDSFAKPREEVTEYRTEFSGVRQQDLENAPDVEEVKHFVSVMVKNKILIGHSIHHDTEVLSINHPQTDIRDTSMYYKKMLKSQYTPSLRELSRLYLDTQIQIGEHSSIEDAQATMGLYLLQRDVWETSVLEGFAQGSISDMHVVPRKPDLFVEEKDIYLRPNITEGAYSSSDRYRDTQFRLLLEDLMRPLRRGVKDYQRWKKSGGRTPKTIRVYQGVRVLSSKDEELRGHQRLSFPLLRNNLTYINWQDCSNLMNGSLVLLTPDDFVTVKFAIVDSVEVNVESYDGHGLVDVTFVRDGPSVTAKESTCFLMLESVQLFAAYRYTLDALQVMDLDKFPMKRYIVDSATDGRSPFYLRSMPNIDFSVMTKKPKGQVLNSMLKLNTWPSAIELGLDKSQYEGLQLALTNEMAIIQGPPGCGKTFMGLQIIKLYITNPHLLTSPILIVASTNHALDQLMENVLEFLVQNKGEVQKAKNSILRIGGGSKSEFIQQLTLKQKRDDTQKKKTKRARLLSLVERHKFLTAPEEFIDLKLMSLTEQELNALLSSDKLLYNIWVKCNKIQEDVVSWFGLLGEFVAGEELSLSSQVRPYKDCAKSKIPSDNVVQNFKTIFRFYQDKHDLELPKGTEAKLKSTLKVPLGKKQKQQNGQTISLSIYKARWTVYMHLLKRLRDVIPPNQEKLAVKIFQAQKEWEMVKNIGEGSHWRNAVIVGMTTTGASKFKKKVMEVKPQLMIVEEAAHVLEAHVVASLTEYCQHMILIGDHKQLRPFTGDDELAKKFGLDVSLMERMVNNGIIQGVQNWVQLKVQHRMKPEIAKLICPTIYEELENHADVETYPNVMGIAKNLFFVDHQQPDEQERDSTSRFNRHEANFVAKLCEYILKQGYEQSQVTIIAAYLGQKTHIEEILQANVLCCDVKVVTVDGFQGKENDIIILTLVRSNVNNHVGFLKTDNRVCVALSRARHGLFLIGNMSALKSSSKTWDEINDTLLRNNSIGKHLPLQCQMHRTITKVVYPNDFFRICGKLCGELLPNCGHKCDALCHSLEAHKYSVCRLPCGKSLTCAEGHSRNCDNMCFETCSKCMVKKNLVCGHPPYTKFCYENENAYSPKCNTLVEIWPSGCQSQPQHLTNVPCCRRLEECSVLVDVKIPNCEHTAKIQCHKMSSENIEKLDLKCVAHCQKELKCGHLCRFMCHADLNPKHTNYQCQEPCIRSCPDKNHKCDGSHKCYFNCPMLAFCQVPQKVQLNCGSKHDIPCYQANDADYISKRKCTSVHKVVKELMSLSLALPGFKSQATPVPVECKKVEKTEVVRESGCGKVFKCGHGCRFTSKNHKHKNYKCMEQCARAGLNGKSHSSSEQHYCCLNCSLTHKKFVVKVKISVTKKSGPSSSLTTAGTTGGVQINARFLPLPKFEAIAIASCGARLPCGYVCRQSPHPKNPNHTMMIHKCIGPPCTRTCGLGHKCKGKHLCNMACPRLPCRKKVELEFPSCGHKKKFDCHLATNAKRLSALKCNRPCSKVLINAGRNFKCGKKCSEPCAFSA